MTERINVERDKLFTARWGLLNNRPDISLNVLDGILGARPGSSRKKVALLVGHNEVSQGAALNLPIGLQEFTYNNYVADALVQMSGNEVEYRKFNRRYFGPNKYTPEITEAYGRIESQWSPDLILELHFNWLPTDLAPRAEMYISESHTPQSNQIAATLSQVFANAFGIDNHGVMVKQSSSRGGTGINHTATPAILTEPFVGNNQNCANVAANLNIQGVANLYNNGIIAGMALAA